jgi:hypothetical protein
VSPGRPRSTFATRSISASSPTYRLELHVGGSESVVAVGWLIGRNGPGGSDPIIGRVEPGPRGEQGPPGEVTRAQSIALSLIFG